MGQRTVTVTIKESSKQPAHGDHPADYKWTVNAPFFDSKQPTTLYVPTDVGDRFDPGAEAVVVIEVGGLKNKPNSNEPYDGQKPWMYSWKFIRLATGEDMANVLNRAAATPPPQPPASPQGAQQPSSGTQPHFDSNGEPYRAPRYAETYAYEHSPEAIARMIRFAAATHATEMVTSGIYPDAAVLGESNDAYSPLSAIGQFDSWFDHIVKRIRDDHD